MTQSLACLNGELMPVEKARVPVWDRGFLFGDAVYEVIRVYGGRCWLESAHLARLKRSMESLLFAPVDLDRLAQRMHRTLGASGVLDGSIYIQVTRGVAPRSHAFPDGAVQPVELIVAQPIDDEEGKERREAGVPVISHPDLRWGRCDVKSTNLLANVLACEAARKVGAYEAILVDTGGLVTEGTRTSVLWVSSGVLGGTPEGPAILPGTTRGVTLRLARELEIPFEPGRIALADLVTADEVMLVGTTSEIVPVTQVDGATVAGGRPGPVTKRLQWAFARAVAQWLSQPVG